MEYIHGNDSFVFERGSAVTFGKFDGVHVGHQKLISIVKEKADEYGLLSTVFTFDRIPLSICPEKQQFFITTNDERRAFLSGLGVDVEVEYPFTQELMNTSPEEFIERIIIKQLNAKIVVVGPDYRFGKNREGDADLLVRKGRELGFETIVVEKERFQDREISSTYVREELSCGHMQTVNILLGRPYSICGKVERGSQFGRTINVPTVNIYPQDSKLLPPNGVYGCTIMLDNQLYYGVTNVGTKPTVSETRVVCVETNLFDFDNDAYEKQIEVSLMFFVRPEMKFKDVDMLKKQIENDVEFAKSMFMAK